MRFKISQYFSQYLLKIAQNKTPKLSLTELEALNVGGTGVERQFFLNKPDWTGLWETQKIELSAEEQSFLDKEVEHLCELLDAEGFTEQQDDLPQSVWEYIKSAGFWGLTIPKIYGGYEFSSLAHAAIIMKLASRSYSVAISIMVPNAVGPAEFVYTFGTPEQKDFYLPRLVRGEEIACFALTSNEAGSDASSIIDEGIVDWGEYQGKSIVGIRLNFNKRYITLAPIATLIGVAFKLIDPNNLLEIHEKKGITLALIPANHPGITSGARHRPLNLAFMNGPLQGENVFIPLDWVIGGRGGCGRGWNMLIHCLSLGRIISLPALVAGSAKICLAATTAYAVVRHQFKHSIGQFEGIQQELAKIAGFTYIITATQEFLMQQQTRQGRNEPNMGGVLTKYRLTEMARELVNAAMDIHGGRAIQLGSRNYLAMHYQTLPINITVEGANILMRNLITFGQGVMRCHPYVPQIFLALHQSDPKQNLIEFDRYIWQQLGRFSRGIVTAFLYGLSGGRLIRTRAPKTFRRWIRQLTRMSNAFSIITDITLLLIGKKLKTAEAITARLSDILSYLYIITAVINYHQQNQKIAQDRLLADWSINYCLVKIQAALTDLLDNYPRPLLGRFLKRIIFPWGNAYLQSNDSSTFFIAKLVQQNSELRCNLIKGCYLGKTSAAYQVEAAMQSYLENVSLIEKCANKLALLAAVGKPEKITEKLVADAMQDNSITELESEKLMKMYRLCREAILVDAT